jgi:hypothetical protein
MTVKGGDTVDPPNKLAHAKFNVACMHFLHAFITDPTRGYYFGTRQEDLCKCGA